MSNLVTNISLINTNQSRNKSGVEVPTFRKPAGLPESKEGDKSSYFSFTGWI